MIRAEGITKVFGPDPESVLPLLEQGKSKDEIGAETGYTVGINNASFELDPGEVFCIMGLSGSGKSTLIRCVNRIIEPTAGKIFFNDPDSGGEREITAMGAEELRALRGNHMSMVFQHFALFPHRTVIDNAIYGLEIRGQDKNEARKVGQEVLELVGLGGWGNVYPAQLSGGMQQRVGLARALATKAKVLLMDEPFSALDPLIKVNMQQSLIDIQGELRRTILFITHDLDEAMRIGNRIAIMDAGEIVQIGTPEEILVNPKTEYVADFVEHADATNVITARTIARPFTEARFEQVHEADGVTWHSDREQPELRYGVDKEGRLQGVTLNDSEVRIEQLDEAVEAQHDGRQREDVALRCDGHAVLRTVLKGRTYSGLPSLVTDGDGKFIGIIDEPELITGILDKRGQSERTMA